MNYIQAAGGNSLPSGGPNLSELLIVVYYTLIINYMILNAVLESHGINFIIKNIFYTKCYFSFEM